MSGQVCHRGGQYKGREALRKAVSAESEPEPFVSCVSHKIQENERLITEEESDLHPLSIKVSCSGHN